MAKGESGFDNRGGGKATPQQEKMMNNMKNRNANNSAFSEPTFKTNKDGTVSFEFTKKRIINYVHNSKMQSEDKNDVYERTEYHSGRIMKDGLLNQNKTTYEDVLIKKGRSSKR